MNDRRPYSLLHVRELEHGIHDLPEFDTSDFRLFAFRLEPNETRLPVARTAETLLLVIEGNLTVAWHEAPHVPAVLHEGDTVFTNPPAVEALRAGADGAAFLALVSRS
jgi:hypothetical protein